MCEHLENYFYLQSLVIEQLSKLSQSFLTSEEKKLKGKILSEVHSSGNCQHYLQRTNDNMKSTDIYKNPML